MISQITISKHKTISKIGDEQAWQMCVVSGNVEVLLVMDGSTNRIVHLTEHRSKFFYSIEMAVIREQTTKTLEISPYRNIFKKKQKSFLYGQNNDINNNIIKFQVYVSICGIVMVRDRTHSFDLTCCGKVSEIVL